MFAQVIHDLVDLIPGMHPNMRAELHERIGEESAAAVNAAAVKADTPPEPEPPAEAAAV